ncbi:MAG: hypothetical protein ABIK26_09290 [Candidatus Omnitrophota bacterium]|nr:hypothetical protein [Candidatus Omnitrophota bacterium]
MLSVKERRLSNLTLVIVFLFFILYFIFVQFVSPVLFGVDGYYHVAAASFIKDFGPDYNFRWTQFSTFKEFFSDKEFLFHIFIIPFLFFSDNIILAGKLAVIFYNLLFALVYVFLLKKYLPSFLAALFLFFLLSTQSFAIYFIYLRPATLGNVFTILGIYFLINKKPAKLFLLSLLYSLAHISFFTIIVLAFICEILRYIVNREFFLKNVYLAIFGCALGCFLHPNFPNNLISFHLNAVLVPIYSITGVGLDFGRELYSSPTKVIFIKNFSLLLTFNIVLWVMFFSRIRVSFATLVWWSCSSVYLILSFFGVRYWYTANVLFFIFFASYLKDWLGQREWRQVLGKINIFIALYAVSICAFSFYGLKYFREDLEGQIMVNIHYEDIASWMKKHIPPGETIYHAYWSDSPYFICLNPKNNYFVVLDPIYMYYRYPKEYSIYTHLKRGHISNPYVAFKKRFKVNYGYVRKDSPLSSQIKEDTDHFKVLYENYLGVVFEVLNKEEQAQDLLGSPAPDSND